MHTDFVIQAADYLRIKLPFFPKLAIILGSGLGNLVDHLEKPIVIPYREIPHFPHSTVVGHAGNLVAGFLRGRPVLVMQGRFHFYEGFSMTEVTFPLYVLRQLGIEQLIITNAAGGINREFLPGDLMLITDHINLLGTNPLIGPNDERFGPRFPDLSQAYAPRLRQIAKTAARELGLAIWEGVYLATTGPSFETAAEIRAFSVLGADAVGMSTVPEVIAANYLGMEVLGISCITNLATGLAGAPHSHMDVVHTALSASSHLCSWVEAIVQRMP